MKFGLIEIVAIIAAVGIAAAVVVIPRLSDGAEPYESMVPQGVERHELPPAVQDLQDKGADFIYNEHTGRIHLLEPASEEETPRSHGWVSPIGGTGFVIIDNKLIVVGEAMHSISWYCFKGIDYVLIDETEEFYECGI
jgi:hypothetical protein